MSDIEKLFRDLADRKRGDRRHNLPVRMTTDELTYLHERAEKEGVHTSTLIRRCIRQVLIGPLAKTGDAA